MSAVSSRISLGAVASVVYVSAALAGARLDLRPTPPMPSGGYAPNTIINVDVFMVDTGNPQGDVPFRSILLDFADTTGTLTFPGADMVRGNDDDDRFQWYPPAPDVSFIIPDLPTPAWTVFDLPSDPRFLFTLPNDGEMRLGAIAVYVGIAGGVLDVLNADEQAADRGAVVLADLPDGSAFYWRAFTGNLTGGRLDVVVAEPATMSLIIGASAAYLFRCRRGTRRRRTGKPGATAPRSSVFRREKPG